jgi:hypothetical protein
MSDRGLPILNSYFYMVSFPLDFNHSGSGLRLISKACAWYYEIVEGGVYGA